MACGRHEIICFFVGLFVVVGLNFKNGRDIGTFQCVRRKIPFNFTTFCYIRSIKDFVLLFAWSRENHGSSESGLLIPLPRFEPGAALSGTSTPSGADSGCLTHVFVRLHEEVLMRKTACV